MNIWQRAKIGWDVFRHGYPASAFRQEGKAGSSSVLGWPTLGDVQPEWHLVDYTSYVEQGVNINAVIYAALRYKWSALSSVTLRAWGGDRDHPEPLDPGHPLAKLVDRPNPYQDWRTLQQRADAFLNIAGYTYFWLRRPKRGEGLPEAIYSPRPDRVFVVPDRRNKDEWPALLGYLYVPEGKPWGSGVPILPKDIMAVRLPNPMDSLEGLGEGLSPLMPAGHSVDVDNNVTRFLKLFFEKGGVPPYWFTFDEPLQPADLDKIRKQAEEIYGGYEGWTKHGVLDRGGDVKRVGLTFEEMGFSDIDERNESRILGPLGVPGALIGTRLGLQRAIRANIQEIRRTFWEDTMIPELSLFEAEFQYYLKSEDGAFVMFDYSKVPALQKDMPVLVEAAHRLWQMGVPANQAFETVGVPVGEVPGGDVGYVPIGAIPSAAKPPELPRTEEGAPEAEEEEDEGRKLLAFPKAHARR